MTATTIEQLLDAYRVAVMPRATNRRQRVREIRDTILARYAELERERDEARAAAEKEFASVMALSAERDAYKADAEQLRASVIEECAQLVDRRCDSLMLAYKAAKSSHAEGRMDEADSCAQAIRALKSREMAGS